MTLYLSGCGVFRARNQTPKLFAWYMHREVPNGVMNVVHSHTSHSLVHRKTVTIQWALRGAGHLMYHMGRGYIEVGCEDELLHDVDNI